MRNTGFKAIFLYFLFISFVITLSTRSYAEIPAEDIPPGYQFPSPREEVQGWSNRRDIRAARSHAWYLWEGMNQPSTFRDKDGNYLPVWETWYSNDELFPPAKNKPHKNLKDIYTSRKYVPRKLVTPRQFGDQNADQILSFNKFNPAAAMFIVTPHEHWGETFQYNRKSSLMALNEMYNKKNTPISERKIDEFPPRAIETKPVFMLVKARGLTPVPYWQGAQNSVTPTDPVPSSWINCVLIDPSSDKSLRPASSKQIKMSKKNTGKKSTCKSFLYAGISQIYHYPLKTAADVSSFKNDQGISASIGDFAVLVAMHINTKEIVNWTWQTFFWSGGETPPDSFPGGMSLQPESLKAPWNNYAMCTAYWQENLDGSIHTCFNPYLETSVTGIPDGLNSNCISCHGIARTRPLNNASSPVPDYPKNYIRANKAGPGEYDPYYFMGNTRTDFSWAIPDESH
ncbi:hypothetical protein MNBD_GAMMA11-1614 [hydrothermal vent metagenome]|uniref:Uncharacterized protein n=1 Tax=hydrothermal vent metagenome TaxID=652676 RepID=A0A3B0XAU3_9ZZZZ